MGSQYTTLGVTQYTQLPPLKHFRYALDNNECSLKFSKGIFKENCSEENDSMGSGKKGVGVNRNDKDWASKVCSLKIAVHF